MVQTMREAPPSEPLPSGMGAENRDKHEHAEGETPNSRGSQVLGGPLYVSVGVSQSIHCEALNSAAALLFTAPAGFSPLPNR